jgi:hypothetical protein
VVEGLDLLSEFMLNHPCDHLETFNKTVGNTPTGAKDLIRQGSTSCGSPLAHHGRLVNAVDEWKPQEGTSRRLPGVEAGWTVGVNGVVGTDMFPNTENLGVP